MQSGAQYQYGDSLIMCVDVLDQADVMYNNQWSNKSCFNVPSHIGRYI